MTETTEGRSYPPGQHPDLPPPSLSIGPVAWIWKNLFGTVTNTVLTLLAVYLIWRILPGVVEFFLLDAVIVQDFTLGALFLPATYIEHGEGATWRYVVGFLLALAAIATLVRRDPKRPKLMRWLALPLFAVAAWAVIGDLDVAFADSRKLCRAAGEGACWALIVERFELSIFYQYPEAERYRLILAFILLFVALGALLFDRFPFRRRMMWFSAAYPFIAFLLIAGPLSIESMRFTSVTDAGERVASTGPYWWMILFVLGLAGIYVGRTRGVQPLRVLGYALVAVTVIPFLLSDRLWVAVPEALGLTNAAEGIYLLEPVSTDKFGGVMLTLIVGLTGISVSLPFGIVLALGRVSDMPAVKSVCVAFIEFIRGVPLITLLFIASVMLNYFLPPGTQFDLLLRVLIMVVFFASAYIAEVVRGGLQSIPKGQYEAADSMGLTYWQSMRLVILPQALKVSIPGIVNTFIGLYKDTTLVIIIGLFDVLGVMRSSLADPKWNGLSIEAYAYTAIFFFISCFAMSRYSLWLEKRLHTGHSR